MQTSPLLFSCLQVMDITEKERIDDQGNKPSDGLTTEQFCIIYAVCHVMGMLSACANPVIYGYLNENFNREFKEIFLSISECVKWPCGSVSFRRKQRAAAAAAGAATTAGAAAATIEEDGTLQQNGRTVTTASTATVTAAGTNAVFINGNGGSRKVKVVALNGQNGMMEMQPLNTIREGGEEVGGEVGRRQRGPEGQEAAEDEQEALLKKV